MDAEIYEQIPDCAREIRHRVFVEEQGFREEFDDVDHRAAHIVLYDQEKTPVGTCRIFWDEAMDCHVLGRLAVVKEYRGRQAGAAIMEEAEQYVRRLGGSSIVLHAPCRAAAFYQKCGYTEFGEIADDQGCHHIWMRKYFQAGAKA